MGRDGEIQEGIESDGVRWGEMERYGKRWGDTGRDRE